MATSKKTSTRSKASAKKGQNKNTGGNPQVSALILMALAILVSFFAIIPGENVWTAIHNFLLGTFSFSVYMIPALLAFFSVMTAFEKDSGKVSARVWQGSLITLLLDSTIYTFMLDSSSAGFGACIKQSYAMGKEYAGGGAFGSFLGWPMEKLFGDLGAKIFLILMLLVLVMLLTGTTVASVLRTIRKPVDQTKKSIESAMDRAAERRENSKKAIDVEMGDGYASKRRKKKEPLAEAVPVDEEALVSDKLDDLQRANEALNEKLDVKVEPEEEEMMTAEEAEAELEQDLAAAEEMEQPSIYRYPPLSLLDSTSDAADARMQDGDRAAVGTLLVNTLKDFGINTELGDVTCGPSVTRYELVPSAGVKISRITGLSDDIALRLATTGVRIEAPIPNKAAVGIEVPNKSRRTVRLHSLLDTAEYRNAKGKLTVALGQDIEGRAVYTDLAKMPHLLIAGTTGSGKSVCTNSMIQSVLFRARPDEVKMILIDPKKVEFGVYNGVPHLMLPVVTDPRKAAATLGWAVNEMLKRYQMFAESKARDIGDYNEIARKEGQFPPLPLILIVIDELADLMMAAGNEVEDSICRLAQMARAAGMHMVIATQRPSVDVITGLIKGNIPSRLALTVASGVDSRTILDGSGAEKLLGNGDMLFMPLGQSKPQRIQGCYVSNKEIERVIEFLKDSDKPIEYDQEMIEEIERQAASAGGKRAGRDDEETGDEVDEALSQAIEIAVEAGSISTSMLQRKMRLGYARAGRIIDQMEQRGIVGPSEGSKPRKVLISRQEWIEMSINNDQE
ncbi:MAG: DNA translocase FtsK [Ruminococcaceae bacterium]|nr:DNA translocase FtsK [Oscillospiraceae bacterium]